MRLIRDWKTVLRYAWSIRLIVIAALLSGIEVTLPFIEVSLPIPQGLFAALSAVTVGGAFVARLIAQERCANK